MSSRKARKSDWCCSRVAMKCWTRDLKLSSRSVVIEVDKKESSLVFFLISIDFFFISFDFFSRFIVSFNSLISLSSLLFVSNIL